MGWSNSPTTPEDGSRVNVVPATLFSGFADPDGGGFYVAFQSLVTNDTQDCLYQDPNTVAGQTYTLSFLAAITGPSSFLELVPEWDANGANRVKLALDGFNVGTNPTSSSAAVQFKSFSFHLTASGSITRIYFHGVDSSGAILLDSVSLTADQSIPEPLSPWLVGFGLATLGLCGWAKKILQIVRCETGFHVTLASRGV